MNKKSLIAIALAITTVGTATITTYASQNVANSTKNKVVTVNSKSEISLGKISDEEAIQMATKAMKDYMGKDANSFSETKIFRSNNNESFAAQQGLEIYTESTLKEDAQAVAENAQKPMANVIEVKFTPADESHQFANCKVTINEESGEIVGMTALMNLDKKGESAIDDNKIQAATINFFKLMGKDVQADSIRVQKMNKKGILYVLCNLKDGRKVSLLINSANYTVVQYQVNYNRFKTLPSQEKSQNENFRNLQIQ